MAWHGGRGGRPAERRAATCVRRVDELCGAPEARKPFERDLGPAIMITYILRPTACSGATSRRYLRPKKISFHEHGRTGLFL